MCNKESINNIVFLRWPRIGCHKDFYLHLKHKFGCASGRLQLWTFIMFCISAYICTMLYVATYLVGKMVQCCISVINMWIMWAFNSNWTFLEADQSRGNCSPSLCAEQRQRWDLPQLSYMNYSHNISAGLSSGISEGHSKTLILFLCNDYWLLLDALSPKIPVRDTWLSWQLIAPSIVARCPKRVQTMKLPPPCFTDRWQCFLRYIGSFV